MRLLPLALAFSLVAPRSALPQPIHLDKRVTPATTELVLRLDAPSHVLFVKRGPGDALEILWPKPRPDSLLLLESGAWVVVRRPVGMGFFFVEARDCELKRGCAMGVRLESGTVRDDYVEVIAIDLGRSYGADRLELAVTRLSSRGSRRELVQRLVQQLGDKPPHVSWAATRVPAIRP